jgi:hypothetical protein
LLIEIKEIDLVVGAHSSLREGDFQEEEEDCSRVCLRKFAERTEEIFHRWIDFILAFAEAETSDLKRAVQGDAEVSSRRTICRGWFVGPNLCCWVRFGLEKAVQVLGRKIVGVSSAIVVNRSDL